MNNKFILIACICLFFSIASFSQECISIRIIPYHSKSGKIDKFKLSELVLARFKSAGYLFHNSDSTNNQCSKFKCIINHTENYWEYKKDTVTLYIYDSLNSPVGQYLGITNEIEMTFKSAYIKATNMAIDKIIRSDLFK